MIHSYEISDEAYSQLDDIISEWQGIVFESPYWFDGDEEYCGDCAVAEATRRGLTKGDIDGGWAVESDHTLFCTTCGKPLEHTLTDYGTEQELIHYEQEGLPGPEEEESLRLAHYTLVCVSGGVPLCHQRRLYRLIFGEEPPGADDDEPI